MIKYILASVVLVTTLGESFAQCSGVSVDAATGFVSAGIDSLQESDGLRNGLAYDGATLYYPVGLSGSYNSSIVLAPGYSTTRKSVAQWGRFLAAHGFVCMTIGTNDLYENPQLRAKALLDAMETLRQENSRATSVFYHRLDTANIAVGGWSMGGGGAQLAAKMDSGIRAVLAITPWLDTVTLVPSDLNHSAPVCIISCQADLVAPPASYANVHYNYTPKSTEKLLFEVVGGDHHTALDPSTGDYDLGNVVVAWLNLALGKDTCWCNIVKNDSLNLNVTASSFRTNIDCFTPVTLNETNKHEAALKVYPNPAYSYLIVEGSKADDTYIIYSSDGRPVSQGRLQAGKAIDINALSPGMYQIRLGNVWTKFVKMP